MKVLHISNYYYNRGGDCTHLFSMKKLLEDKGHDSMVFSMHHPDNLSSAYSDYFVSYIDYAEEVKKRSVLNAGKVVFRAIYSVEAKKKIESLIRREKPDIAHIQSLHHHLTHSILYPLRKSNIPIVWTLHDYALLCPNTLFLCRGEVCEKCKTNRYYWPVITKCKKDSAGASMAAALEAFVHRAMRIEKLIDVFITPSNFLRNKLIEYGFNERKIICLNNFIDFKIENDLKSTGDYYLYCGRLTKEKGVKSLVEAAVNVKSSKLKIVGDGPLREELTEFVKSRGMEDRIEFLGHVSRNDVIEIVKSSSFVVVPSEWYENFPYAILEAFACQKPVIGSRIGGVSEMIDENITGLLFEPGNSGDLTAKIEYLISNPGKASEMGKNARGLVETKLNAEKHYQGLIGIYNRLIK